MTPLGGLRCAVVGAGIVGTSIALALQKRGADVVLIDRDEPGSGCSFGNSGAISEMSVVPLAMPGVLASVPSMVLDPASALRLPWRHLPFAMPWLLSFVASARRQAVRAASERLHALHQGAAAAHEAMARDIGAPELFLRQGHLHLYPDEATLAKDAVGWGIRRGYGFVPQRLDRAGIEALEPNVAERYRIGLFLPDHATILNPYRYVQAMARAFFQRGGRIVRAAVQRLRARGSTWDVVLDNGAYESGLDRVVVAAGVWSKALLNPLGVRIKLESQRGYHVQYSGGRGVISRTVVLADRKVFVAPMEDGLRIGGTVEIGGLRAPPDPQRAVVLDRIARESFRGLDGLPVRTWMGHRPCTPDSLPIIGPVDRHPGLWVATGHGHLGLTDSLNTAERVGEGLVAKGAWRARSASRGDLNAAMATLGRTGGQEANTDDRY